MANEDMVIEILEDLADMIHNWRITERTIRIWCEDLQDIPDQVLDAAYRHYRRSLTSKYAPKPMPGDIREIALDMVVPDCNLAWEEIMSVVNGSLVMSNSTGMPSRTWKNPLIPKILPMLGGLRSIAEAPERRIPLLKMDFEKAYKRILERTEQESAMRISGIATEVAHSIAEPAVKKASLGPAPIQVFLPSAEEKDQVKTLLENLRNKMGTRTMKP